VSFYSELSYPGPDLCKVRVFAASEREEIKKIYGKSIFELTAPEGYEFTGEFRAARVGEIVVNEYAPSMAFVYTSQGINKPELILRKIETKEEEDLSPAIKEIAEILGKRAAHKIADSLRTPEQLSLPLSPAPVKGYTAAEVTERYGKNVLTMFGYREPLVDYPGFVYSGLLTNVNPGEWCVSMVGPRKWQNHATSSYLTLIPTTPEQPRIVTFTLTAAEDFEDGEARYIQDDQGGFVTATGPEVSTYAYSRSEVE
jgi:hypothetical protein